MVRGNCQRCLRYQAEPCDQEQLQQGDRREAFVDALSCLVALGMSIAVGPRVVDVLYSKDDAQATATVLPGPWGLLVLPLAEFCLFVFCATEIWRPRGFLRMHVGARLPVVNAAISVSVALAPLWDRSARGCVILLSSVALLVAASVGACASWRGSRKVLCEYQAHLWVNGLFCGSFSYFFGSVMSITVVAIGLALNFLGVYQRPNADEDVPSWEFWRDEVTLTTLLLWGCTVVCAVIVCRLRDGAVALAPASVFAAIATRQFALRHGKSQMCLIGESWFECHDFVLWSALAAAWVIGLSTGILFLGQLRRHITETTSVDLQLRHALAEQAAASGNTAEAVAMAAGFSAGVAGRAAGTAAV